VILGALSSGLVTGLREGVEAALIVSIIAAYLVKTGNAAYLRRVWLGAGAAIGLSAIAGVALYLSVGGLKPPYEQVFEGATLLLAAVVVTWMLFWMRRQAAGVSGQLRAAVDRAVGSSGEAGLVLLAFTAIIREGIETSLFLVGQLEAAGHAGDAGPVSVLVGAVVGLAIAAAIGYGFYRGTRRIDLAIFFRWTGIALVFIAAGLLSQGLHEFIEVGAIRVGNANAFDISSVLPDNAGIGQFLRALVGYSAAPEVLTLGAHIAYLLIVLGLYLRPLRPSPARPRPGAETARS
jgi:high-affinity iron transporter